MTTAAICLTSMTFITMIQVGRSEVASPFTCTKFPECNATVMELIKMHDYKGEEHKVTTEDGYILGVQRIPVGKKVCRNDKEEKPAILLVHGLFSSATYYVVNGPEYSIGFLLADAGFDVWLANLRGNRYSRAHTFYKPNEPAFWRFNFDDYALKDVPQMIDYILSTKKKHKKVQLVGYSMGTSIILGTLSGKPEYKSKVDGVYLFAPNIFTSGIPDKNPKEHREIQEASLDYFKPTEAFFPTPQSYSSVKQRGECEKEPLKNVCEFVEMKMGSSKYINQSKIPVYWSTYPSGTSTYLTNQILDMKICGRFQREMISHSKVFKVCEQQEYDVKSISVPIVLYSSLKDEAVDQSMLSYLHSKLNKKYIVGDHVLEDYIHADFVYSMTARKLIYDPMIQQYLRPKTNC